MALIVPPSEQQRRMQICKACKWRKPTTNSCGTLYLAKFQGTVENDTPKENLVHHYKRKIRLCGCHLNLKTKWALTSCPAGKWGAYRLTQPELIELKKYVMEIENKTRFNQSDLQDLFGWKSKIDGKKHQPTSCVPCIKTMIEELKQAVTHIDGNVEE